MKILVSVAATLLSTSIYSVAIAQESTKGDVEKALALLEARGDAVCFPYAGGKLENGDAKDNYAFTRDAEPFRVNFVKRISQDTVTSVKVLGQSTILFSEREESSTQENYHYGVVNLDQKTYAFSNFDILTNGQEHRIFQFQYRCLFLDDGPN